MGSTTLDLNIISAKELKDEGLFSKMSVYAVVSVTGDPQHYQIFESPVHRHAGSTATWNFAANFSVSESLAVQNRLILQIEVFRHRSLLRNKRIGRVRVPVKELLEQPGDGKSMQYVNYQARRRLGQARGVVNVSYKFGEISTAALSPYEAEPVVAYPPPYCALPLPQQYGFPAPPPYGGYPLAIPECGYGHPNQPGYGYLRPQPECGFGYPPQPGYGYLPPLVEEPTRWRKLGSENENETRW